MNQQDSRLNGDEQPWFVADRVVQNVPHNQCTKLHDGSDLGHELGVPDATFPNPRAASKATSATRRNIWVNVKYVALRHSPFQRRQSAPQAPPRR